MRLSYSTEDSRGSFFSILLLTQSFAPQWFLLLTPNTKREWTILTPEWKRKEPVFLLKDCMKRRIFGPCYKGVTGGIPDLRNTLETRRTWAAFFATVFPQPPQTKKLHVPLLGGTVPSLSSSVWFLLWSSLSFSSRNSYKGWLCTWANPQKPDKPVIEWNHITNNSIKLNHYMPQLRM